jgi:hypothetical protein
MSHIIITTTPVKIVITYNDESDNNGDWTVKNINRRCLSECNVVSNSNKIEITLRTGVVFHLDWNVVDLIDGVAPTSGIDLADKLSDLIL